MFRHASIDVRPRFVPCPVRHFGAGDLPPMRGWEQTAWIPRRKPAKKETAKEDIVVAQTPPPEHIWSEADFDPVRRPKTDPPPVRPASATAEAMVRAANVFRKKGVRIPSGKGGTAGQARSSRPVLSSSLRNMRPRQVREHVSARPKKAPAPLQLGDPLYAEVAAWALERFRPPRIIHGDVVMTAALSLAADESAPTAHPLIEYAVRLIRESVADADKSRMSVDLKFLRAAATRVYGELAGQAWAILSESRSIGDEPTIAKRLARLRRAGSGDGAVLEHDILLHVRGSSETYFLIEKGRRRRSVIHTVMTPSRFRRWLRGYDCCGRSATHRPPARHGDD